MDQESPDEYASSDDRSLAEQSRELLTSRHKAVVAMASGGCARYAFSMDIDFCLDRQGLPLIHYSSENAHHHLIVTNSTMDFRLVQSTTMDGVELSILILTGMLTLVNPGDHDSIDRHARYFNLNVENYSSGNERLYRLIPSHARMELVSGKPNTLVIKSVIQRNIWTPSEEDSLMGFANALLNDADNGSLRFVGVDGFGADVSDAGTIRRLLFQHKASKMAHAEREFKKLVKKEPVLNP